MSKKGVPQTEEHKRNIGKANKGIHANEYCGKLILKDGKKLCPVCKRWKLLSEYDKRPERPIGVKPKCKICSKTYRAGMPEMVKFAQYKSGAKRRGLEFRLTKDEFQTFWQKPCSYCGDRILTIGLDRIDSEKGYFIDNVIPCCSICNTMKLAIPRSIFIEHCYKIIKNQSKT